MKIVVCIKRIPDTATKLKVASDGKSIESSGFEYVISPYDEIAMEHAVQIKEKKAGTEVVVISVGHADTEKNMRTCLAMGADRGILLENNTVCFDPFLIANALSPVISGEKPDLVLFGIKAGDDDSAQVGAMVAVLLGLPFIDGAVKLEVLDKGVKARCEVDGIHQVMETNFPCVVSINKGEIKEARICSLINIRKAKSKELKKIPCQLSAPTMEIHKMELPPERKAGKIVGKGPDAVPELIRLLQQEAKLL